MRLMPRSAGASGEKKEFKFVTATEFCRTHLLDSTSVILAGHWSKVPRGAHARWAAPGPFVLAALETMAWGPPPAIALCAAVLSRSRPAGLS